MARPKSIPSEQILEAARRLFLKRGHRCPTSVIAREAGVSEGTIFKRFGTKDRLFSSAMGLPEFSALEGLSRSVGIGEVRDTIETLADDLIAYFRLLIPTIMRLQQSPGFNPLVMLKENADAAPHQMLKGITEYFEAEIRAGRLREADPEVVARMLIGSVHNYVFFESIGVHSRMPIAASSYVRALLGVLWSGIAPLTPDGQATTHP